MKLARISDEEIRQQTKAPVILSGHKRVAQAQIESCEKEVEREINKATKEGWDECEKEAQEKMREIFDWIKDTDIQIMLSPRKRIELQALEQKYLKEEIEI